MLKGFKSIATTATFNTYGSIIPLRKGYLSISETRAFNVNGTDISFSRGYIFRTENGPFILTGSEIYLKFIRVSERLKIYKNPLDKYNAIEQIGKYSVSKETSSVYAQDQSSSKIKVYKSPIVKVKV